MIMPTFIMMGFLFLNKNTFFPSNVFAWIGARGAAESEVPARDVDAPEAVCSFEHVDVSN